MPTAPGAVLSLLGFLGRPAQHFLPAPDGGLILELVACGSTQCNRCSNYFHHPVLTLFSFLLKENVSCQYSIHVACHNLHCCPDLFITPLFIPVCLFLDSLTPTFHSSESSFVQQKCDLFPSEMSFKWLILFVFEHILFKDDSFP